MKKNERLVALQVLIYMWQNKVPLTHAMATQPTLSPFSKVLCFGMCRHYVRLNALAECLVQRRPKQLEIWLCILMGLYQLHYLDTPDFAVVKETVALLDKIKATWAKGLVNAVLRRYCRERETLLSSLQDSPLFHYGHPLWFIQRLQQAWPHDWQSILKANDEHPPMSLRINIQQTTTEAYLHDLKDQGIEARHLSRAPNAISLTTPCDVNELPGFADGKLSVQDEAAQLAAGLLALKPGLRVLDACAAPGGKTAHMLETEPHLSQCLALDADGRRLARAKDTLTRLHLQADLQKGDALKPELWWDGQLFDRILLDAPCSATGVIRRHPDIKLQRTETEISTIIQTQQALLQALWPLLAPGGRMVYATCSVLPEENEQQIATFIKTQEDCAFLNETQPWGHATGHGWQILPGEQQMDGFFYSVLLKK